MLNAVHILKGLVILEVQVLAFILRINFETYQMPPIIPQSCPIIGVIIAFIVAYPTLKIRFMNYYLKWKVRLMDWRNKWK